MDRQIQNLEDNYKFVRKIRDDENMFHKVIEFLMKNFVLITKKADTEIKKIDPKESKVKK